MYRNLQYEKSYANFAEQLLPMAALKLGPNFLKNPILKNRR